MQPDNRIGPHKFQPSCNAGLGLRVCGLGSRVWGLGFRVQGPGGLGAPM